MDSAISTAVILPFEQSTFQPHHLLPMPLPTSRHSALGIRSASSLLDSPPEPIDFIIDKILPVGVTLMAAAPKQGKSFLALSAALSIATGRNAFGEFPVQQGEVLYLDCDMASEQRFHSRMKKLIAPWEVGGETISGLENLSYTTKRMTMDDGLLDEIKSWARHSVNPKLVVVDTYGSVKGKNLRGNPYQQELECIGKFSALSKQFNISVLLIHHAAKNKKSGGLDSVLGSTSIVGSVDNIMILSEKILRVTGRDNCDQTFRVGMNLEVGEFTLTPVDESEVVERVNGIPRQIAEHIRMKNGDVTRKEIQEVFGNSAGNDQALSRLTKSGTLVRTGNGSYRHRDVSVSGEDDVNVKP